MTTPPSTPIPPGLDARTRWIVAAMAAAACMAVLTGTTVTATLDALAPELGTSLDGVVWVTTVYLVAASASVPLLGWLTARIGADRVVLVSLLAFAAGSLLSGLAWDVGSMIAFRALQGLAGGLLEPAALAAIGLVTPRARMGRVMGVASLAINIGPVAGPLLGGLLVGMGAWRWIFWINVPLAIVIALAAWRLLPRTGRGEAGSLDLVGLATLPPGFVLLLVALNRSGAGAEAWIVAASAVAGAALLAAYVVHARRATRPLLDLRLVRHPGFAAALGAMGAVGLVMYALLTSLPLLAVRDLGLEGGWRTLPVALLGLGLLVSMTLAGRWSDAAGTRIVVRCGAVGTAVVAAALWLGHASWHPTIVMAMIVALGLTFGTIASPAFASVYRVLPTADVAQGTAALFIVTQLLASAGVTVVGVLAAASSDPAGTAIALVAGIAIVVAIIAGAMPGRAVQA